MSDDEDDPDKLLLRGARLVLPGALVEGEDLLVEDGRVARLGPSSRRASARARPPGPDR